MTNETGKIALALSKAQGEIKGAKKDTTNPFYKSSYADLASVWDACREALSRNELAVAQTTDIVDGQIVLKTVLLHSSGESLTGILPVMIGDKPTAQALGSAITYNRRYALSAMVGIAPEEDDGNAANESPMKKWAKAPPPETTDKEKLKAGADAFLKKLGEKTSKAAITSLVTNNNALLQALHATMPELYESVSVEINRHQEAFDLAAKAPF